ncbi:N-acyl homoserine lactonase family protein [Sphingomonas sp.]|jgi:glyoxylase-like metal-dependent hydrolase (beta-lactamase superfamily II)|uniref:N-acyl homoserine lactonase family protein n=1 Tax=Sphingomonas sp. TaxID=28214 RepID=UPI002D7F62C0|nr:N-acyl homoserine lactonase family protein [Sphingomonas sp.]HEU0043740.1 N-acyl homoserine lactonase family protein [Sphingomonas sp.]
MKKTLIALAVVALGGAAVAQQAAPAPVRVTLTRLDCGRSAQPRDLAAFSDTYAMDGFKKALVASCYLIRHGDEYLLWDTGYAVTARDNPQAGLLMPQTVVEQLRRLNVDPARVGRVGISHYHGDHTGQARDFARATLLIGAGDWAALTATERAPGVDPSPLAAWVSGGGKVEPVRGDKDVWGDGSVVILDTPGHTPGHHSLLVRLKGKGNVLLTGDLSHFAENYAVDGVPRFNTNRADTLASLHRFKRMAAALKATVVIQHEPADITKLPAFPQAAE